MTDDSTDPRPASMRRRVDFDTTPEPTTPADGLREQLAKLLATPGPLPGARNYTKADAVLAALAGDPGDLPARMADAIRSHDIDESRADWWNEQDPYCVCGEQVKDWDEHAAEVAMSVRWVHAIALEGEVERLRAELAEADVSLNEALNHNDENCEVVAERDALIDEVKTLQGDLEEFGEAQKTWVQFRRERDALKAAVVQVRADALEQRRTTGVTKDPWKLGIYAQACRTLRIFNAVMDAPETTPDAPAGGEDSG